jgi:exodeoxyribonuclease VII large subunit
MASIIKARRAALAGVIGKMDSLSPLAVLARGYSIARRFPAFEVVREAKQMTRGERLKLKLYRGELVCQVDEVEESS